MFSWYLSAQTQLKLNQIKSRIVFLEKSGLLSHQIELFLEQETSQRHARTWLGLVDQSQQFEYGMRTSTADQSWACGSEN